MNKHKVFHARVEALHPLIDFVREALQEAGFDRSSAMHVELALEEAFINIVRYAYAKRSGDIDVEAALTPGREIVFTLKDRGPPFNPLEVEGRRLDPSVPIEEIREGGVGVFFMKQYMDQISYRREEPYNILKLTKKRH